MPGGIIAKNMTHMGMKVSIWTKSCRLRSPVAKKMSGTPKVVPVTSRTWRREKPAEMTVTQR